MLELIAVQGIRITAMSAARTFNLDLFTSVCRKSLKVDTTKGIKTPSQVIIGEEKSRCNEEDVPT
jgi:hypothetical protein